MDFETIKEHVETRLAAAQPLLLRGTANNMYPVCGASLYKGTLRISYKNGYGRFALPLYLGSHRLEEIEAQFLNLSYVPVAKEDEEDAFEVALIKFLDKYSGCFHNTITPEVNVPIMKCIDGDWIGGSLAWERVPGTSFSKKVFQPAKNASIATPFLNEAVKQKGYCAYSYMPDDIRYLLTDCPFPLRDLLELEPQPGRFLISEAMKEFGNGARVRLMECLCEYYLNYTDDKGLTWVTVAQRCKNHDYMEKRHGWLCSDQVERV